VFLGLETEIELASAASTPFDGLGSAAQLLELEPMLDSVVESDLGFGLAD